MFITRQLKGLEDTKSAQFNRYFYLLEVRGQFNRYLYQLEVRGQCTAHYISSLADENLLFPKDQLFRKNKKMTIFSHLTKLLKFHNYFESIFLVLEA